MKQIIPAGLLAAALVLVTACGAEDDSKGQAERSAPRTDPVSEPVAMRQDEVQVEADAVCDDLQLATLAESYDIVDEVQADRGLLTAVEDTCYATWADARARHEFIAWVREDGTAMGDVADKVDELTFALEGYDVDTAAELSAEASDMYFDLYLSVPNATPAGQAAEEAFLACSIAYGMGAEALSDFDADAVYEASDAIDECTGLLNTATEVLTA